MASNYKFSNEEMAAIKAARRETKDKRADARLKALELRAEGMKLSAAMELHGTNREHWKCLRILYFSISLHTHQR